ncbi:response regulator [Ramlibacter sp. MMS24-I3-19]|uniref:response regulator n=1 Tax=Ramlibacter sp. MMS24-I3-19 TaxID=3416606 RepID=UPI003CFE8511
MKILAVDDNALGRAWLREVLGPCTQEIVVARNGDEAWSLLHGGLRPDVCVCDMHVPATGGLRLVERVRADRTLDDLPFVLVSVTADCEDVRQAAARHACAYTLKPFLALQARSALAAAVLASRRTRDAVPA